MKTCPVCHGEVDEKDAAFGNRMVYYFGRFYYLMCQQCHGEFMRDPARYAHSKHRESASASKPCNSPKR